MSRVSSCVYSPFGCLLQRCYYRDAQPPFKMTFLKIFWVICLIPELIQQFSISECRVKFGRDSVTLLQPPSSVHEEVCRLREKGICCMLCYETGLSWLRTCYGAQVGFKPTEILLPLPNECWIKNVHYPALWNFFGGYFGDFLSLRGDSWCLSIIILDSSIL